MNKKFYTIIKNVIDNYEYYNNKYEEGVDKYVFKWDTHGIRDFKDRAELLVYLSDGEEYNGEIHKECFYLNGNVLYKKDWSKELEDIFEFTKVMKKL